MTDTLTISRRPTRAQIVAWAEAALRNAPGAVLTDDLIRDFADGLPALAVPAPAVPDDVAEQVAGWDDLKERLPMNGHEAAELLFDYGDKLADTIEAQAAELARLRGFAEFMTKWAVSFRTSDRDDTIWTTDQWRELRHQIAAITNPTGETK